MHLTRRDFLKDMGLAAGALMLNPRQTGADYATAMRRQYENSIRKQSLEDLKNQLATKFITSTHLNIPNPDILTSNWQWITTEQEEADLRKTRKISEDVENFWGITFIDNQTTRPTYINLVGIERIRSSLENRPGINPDEELDKILQQAILHEMERKVQPIRNFDLPQAIRLNGYDFSEPNNIAYWAGGACGFTLTTRKNTTMEIAPDGSEVLHSAGGRVVGETLPLDIMGAEAAAFIASGQNYSSNYEVGRQWTNIINFLRLQQVAITPQEFLDFHRRSDPIGLGRLIAQRVGFISPSPYETVRADHEASIGMQMLSYAAQLGAGENFNGFLNEIGVKIEYK